MVSANFAEFNSIRHVGGEEYPVVLFTHTTFTDQLAQHSAQLRMVHQSAFNFADHRFGYLDAWDHHVVSSDGSTGGTDAATAGSAAEDESATDLLAFVQADNKVCMPPIRTAHPHRHQEPLSIGLGPWDRFFSSPLTTITTMLPRAPHYDPSPLTHRCPVRVLDHAIPYIFF